MGKCNNPGLTLVDANQVLYTHITEADLTTDYFPSINSSGIAAVKIYETANPTNFSIITNATSVGDVDNSSVIQLSGASYPCTVTCQKAGTLVAEELRLDIVIPTFSNAEAELCVGFDNINPVNYPIDIIGTWRIDTTISGSLIVTATQDSCFFSSTLRFFNANEVEATSNTEGGVGGVILEQSIFTYSINNSFLTVNRRPSETHEIILLNNTTLKIKDTSANEIAIYSRQ